MYSRKGVVFNGSPKTAGALKCSSLWHNCYNLDFSWRSDDNCNHTMILSKELQHLLSYEIQEEKTFFMMAWFWSNLNYPSKHFSPTHWTICFNTFLLKPKTQTLYLTKALTKFKQTKMKRDAQQKCSLFSQKRCTTTMQSFSQKKTAFLSGNYFRFQPFVFH